MMKAEMLPPKLNGTDAYKLLLYRNGCWKCKSICSRNGYSADETTNVFSMITVYC